MPTRIAIAVVEREGQFLIGQRPQGTTLAGKWEFPGGKIEAGESPAEAAARECLEETGVAVQVGQEYPSVRHRYEHDDVELCFFRCEPVHSDPVPSARFRWVEARELASFEFPAANATLIKLLIANAPA